MTPNTHRTAIVTDSTCDIPPDMLEAYGITVVPLYVLWGGKELRDGVDIDRATVYARLRTDPEHPTTSQPTPADFVEAIRATGAEEALVLTISAALSGTYNSAAQAADLLSARVHVEDSRVTAMALGWQVLAAARAREGGADLEGMIAAARAVRARNVTRFTVDTLEYLHRGGRIGGAQHFLGSALQLKPMLSLDQETGRVESVERIRTRRRALQRLVDAAVEELQGGGPLHLAVMHAAAPEEAAAVRPELEARLQPAEVFTAELTPVLGIHGGPGLVGFCAYRE
jgi:DegV family protein with EDD domain